LAYHRARKAREQAEKERAQMIAAQEARSPFMDNPASGEEISAE